MVLITKASGEKVPFDSYKLKASLEKVGANPDFIEAIIEEISNELKEGMSTKHIYRKAFQLLRKTSKTMAAKYHLKRAMMQLGPTGFPFEKFIGALLQKQGYTTQNNVMMQGFCVQHELDVIAEKLGKRVLVECKYHNQQGLKTDVKIPLYFQSRFQDLIKANTENHLFEAGWLVTNTKFTNDAIQYGRCAGLYLISWNYPATHNLKEMIEITGAYPITCLTSLSQRDKIRLLEADLILCQHLLETPTVLEKLHFKKNRINQILKECQLLCISLVNHSAKP